ncbi:integrase [Streptomyces qinzhouensis]|uniref:Integrase n=1 Tax=Streptomyces qinzhouensis TaxID=2599401 RepID=A0A5B8IIC4_9ACTN|nr:integrase [Streptomyces qinzhouensis]QDY78142.1 integrase [Streptomyces qinzhouensis]
MATQSPARGMSREELLALPVAVDLDTANKALTIGRSTGYALAKQDAYPVKVLRLGNAYRVITADLHRLLGLALEPAAGPGGPRQP